MKINLDYALPAFVLNAVTMVMVVISMVGNWLAYYHRAELTQQVSELRQKVECLSLAKELDRQKCSQ